MLLNFIPTESHTRPDSTPMRQSKRLNRLRNDIDRPRSGVSEDAIQNGVPIIGDVKPARRTAIHDARHFMYNRGVHLDDLSDQLRRQHGLRNPYTEARVSIRPSRKPSSLLPYPVMSTGFTHVPLMKDRKTSYWFNAGNFGNAPPHFEASSRSRLLNFAGLLTWSDKKWLDRASPVRWIRPAVLTTPAGPIPDSVARTTSEYVEGKRER